MTASNGSGNGRGNGRGNGHAIGSQPLHEPAMVVLDDRRQMFVAHYVRTLNATDAALKAGYGPTRHAAQHRGSVLLREPAVTAALEQIWDAERAEAQAVSQARSITKAELVARLIPLVRTSLWHFLAKDPEGNPVLDKKGRPTFDFASVPAEAWEAIRRFRFDDKGQPVIEFYNRNQAGFDIAQIMGWIVQKSNVRVIKSLADMSDQELEDIAREAPVPSAQIDSDSTTRH